MISTDLIPSKTFFNLVHIAAIAPVLIWLGMRKGRDVPDWFWTALIATASIMVLFHAWRYMDKSNGLA